MTLQQLRYAITVAETGKITEAANKLYISQPSLTNAIQVLQHVFNSSEEDTVVFGGGYNDIEMFGHAYFSYAMQWADSEVRRSAKHIAENVNTILEDIIRM